MPQTTQNYNLKKPQENEYINVEDFNENADIIDEQLKKQETAVNILAYGFKTITLPTSGWSAAAPFTQTLQVEGITAEDVPTGSLYIPLGTTADQEKVLKKAAGCISYYDTGDGSVTVTCIGKKPEADFQIILKGVV